MTRTHERTAPLDYILLVLVLFSTSMGGPLEAFHSVLDKTKILKSEDEGKT